MKLLKRAHDSATNLAPHYQLMWRGQLRLILTALRGPGLGVMPSKERQESSEFRWRQNSSLMEAWENSRSMQGGSPVTHAPVGRMPHLPPVRYRFVLARVRAHRSASESETFWMIFSVTSAGQEKLSRNTCRDSHTCCSEGHRYAATWFWPFRDKSDYFFFSGIHFFPDDVSTLSAAHRLPHSLDHPSS